VSHPDFSSALFLDESRRRLLAAVGAHAQVVTAATTALEHSVVAARYAGITWDDIGERLGTTRQGAWKRFHKHVTFDARIEDRPWHQSRAKARSERANEESK
jgi:hypothetical protein